MKKINSQELLNKDTLTYQEILNLKKRMTGYSKAPEKPSDFEWKEEYKITDEHTAKGLEYLFRVAFKPSKLQEQKDRFEKEGILYEALRSNCPLGYRELTILLQFDHFTFTGFYDASNYAQVQMGFRALYPLWRTYDKDGDSFEYYLEAGQMQIVG